MGCSMSAMLSWASKHGARRGKDGLKTCLIHFLPLLLTEDVVNRMKGSSPSRREIQRSPRASNGTAPSSLAAEGKPRPTGIQAPKESDSSAEQELYRRYLAEQSLVQEELVRLVKREREAACEAKERSGIIEERQRAAQLAVELQGWEANLRRQEAFYQEQLARIERKNAEIYKMTSEQYQEAAAKAEERIKRRNADPICANLQSEILKCYQENKREVLKCSELAKEYQRCVSAAQKVTKASLLYWLALLSCFAWCFPLRSVFESCGIC
uniref:Coiled-coil-helix-coiled-coil-helix domain containing 6 n=1 Tax=Zonotrichia albicollis TaxID=44394 RepID=A0A8D2NFR7_ZONAL